MNKECKKNLDERMIERKKSIWTKNMKYFGEKKKERKINKKCETFWGKKERKKEIKKERKKEINVKK